MESTNHGIHQKLRVQLPTWHNFRSSRINLHHCASIAKLPPCKPKPCRLNLQMLCYRVLHIDSYRIFFNPALHAAAAASEAEEKETKMRALAPSPGTLTVVVFYV